MFNSSLITILSAVVIALSSFANLEASADELNICEDETQTISCPGNGVILVQDAVYGRSNIYTCISTNDNSVPEDGCAAWNSFNVVSDTCGLKHTCTLKASDDVFGDDPCPGTSKYLRVEYSCVANDEVLKQRQPSTCVTSSINGRQMLPGGEELYCDGGWTVFQKRFDGSLNFQRPWADYKRGFGDLSGEFWLGLDKMHNLTKDRGCRLRIDLWDFTSDHKHALYSDFSVEDESDLYRVHVGGYSGTAGNSFSDGGDRIIDGKPFTTIDRDNDNYGANCAIFDDLPRGGFWYDFCSMAYLNAEWGVPNIHWWLTWKGEESLAKTVMKLRCD